MSAADIHVDPATNSSVDFAAIFDEADPYGFASLWYEARKRDLTMACLPEPRYRRAFEPACANGLLTERLAGRCDSVVAMDMVPRAVAMASERVGRHGNVTLRTGTLPGDWPDGTFDLIVLSEFGYYMSRPDWETVAARAAACLDAQGTIVACHWLPAFRERLLSTRYIHRCIARQPGLHRIARHIEQDFLLEVWSRDGRPLRAREEHAS